MSQRLYDCPQCGAPVKFQSSIAVFAVCEHCRSMVVARDAKVETMGVMAELPPDLSPFQIGTRGEWNGAGFEIVGRIRVTYAQGSWNEWCVLCGDSRRIGWLAEAQGLLMISFETETDGLPTRREECVPGARFRLMDASWTVADTKETECIAGEGELPFVAPPALSRFSADLVGPGGRFGSIEFDEDGTRLFTGDFTDFTALKLQNLRPVPGWNADVAQEKNRTAALQCPQCGAVVNLRAAGQSMSAVCGSCGSVIDTANPQLRIVQAADSAFKNVQPLIPIGTRGNFRGVDWEVIGLCNRKDEWSRWSEYLLFNPWLGFRWLVTFNGHWSFVDRIPAMDNLSGPAITMAGRTYRLFASGTAKVTGVIGEFYWKVALGERAALFDFIAPPFILSKEVYPALKEFAWSHGEYTGAPEVAAAFGMKEPTRPSGIYLNQPNPHAQKWATVKWSWLWSVLAVIGIQVLFAQGAAMREVAHGAFDFNRDAKAAPANAPDKTSAEAQTNVQVTPHFTLDGNTSRVDIEGTAPVDNNWLGASVELVNASTGERFPAQLEIGYYYGSDSDGPWTEGDRTVSVSIPSVPPGEYFLTVETDADPAIRQMPLNLRVVRGGLFWSNFFLMLLLVSVYPVSVLFRRGMFERSRWSDSDFSPYASRSSNDDD